MNTSSLPGNLIGVKIAGQYYNCQTQCDLTITTNITKNPACKPNPGAASTLGWDTNNADSQSWGATFSAQSFLDSITGFKNNNDLMKLLVAGNVYGDVIILTNDVATTALAYDHDFMFEGNGIIASFKLNGPSAGASTYDVSITGNGAPTFTLIPSTT